MINANATVSTGCVEIQLNAYAQNHETRTIYQRYRRISHLVACLRIEGTDMKNVQRDLRGLQYCVMRHESWAAPIGDGALTRIRWNGGEQDSSESLDDRYRDEAAQHDLPPPVQRVYPEDLVVGELFPDPMGGYYLSIRNICANSVDHTKKVGCKMDERLHLSTHGR